jgi:hypothetical protein
VGIGGVQATEVDDPWVNDRLPYDPWNTPPAGVVRIEKIEGKGLLVRDETVGWKNESEVAVFTAPLR